MPRLDPNDGAHPTDFAAISQMASGGSLRRPLAAVGGVYRPFAVLSCTAPARPGVDNQKAP